MIVRRSDALLGLLLSFVLVGPASAQETSAPPEWLDGFEAEVQRVMDDWEVPGLALGVVTDSTVVWTKGFGTRNVAAGTPVTPRTLFAIGSSTKAFTAALIGDLHGDERLSWLTPVRRHLPHFGLKDTLASERTTAIDLLTHRTGLPGHDLLWKATALSRNELVRRLRHLGLSAPFRSTFKYSNLGYVAAGALAGALGGSSWEQLVRRRLFEPLGMNRSTLSVRALRQTNDYARPYEVEDRVVAIDNRTLDAVGPAGSINSSVSDLVAWVQLFLNEGRHEGTQVIDSRTISQLIRPRTVVGEYPIQAPSAVPYTLYALGWFVQPYRGHRLVQHGGNIDGFSALVGFLPDENLGWVILTNRDDGTPATHALMYDLIDRWLEYDGPNWTRRFLEQYGPARQTSSGDGEESGGGNARSVPPRPLEDYVGTYRHPGYGILRITRRGGRLVGHYGTVNDTLRYRGSDAFRMELRVGEDTYYRRVRFGVDTSGHVGSASIAMESAVDPIVFSRSGRD